MNFLKYLSLFLVLHSNSSDELDEFIEKMNLDANEKKKLQKIVKKDFLKIKNLIANLQEQSRQINENHKILMHDLNSKEKELEILNKQIQN